MVFRKGTILTPVNSELLNDKLFRLKGFIMYPDETAKFTIDEVPALNFNNYRVEIKDTKGVISLDLPPEFVIKNFKLNVLERFKQKINENKDE